MILTLAVGSCRKAGTWLVKSNEPQHADAMIMLMGNIAADRILQIADLYQKKVSEEVWIVQEGTGAKNILEERGVHILGATEQTCNALKKLGVPAEKMVLVPGGARSTQMEAEFIRDYLQVRLQNPIQSHFQTESSGNIDTLLLVSSASHMRRASMIFSAALKPLDQSFTICCSPSPYSDFSAERWWRDREDIQHVVFEYLKIMNFVLFEKRKLR